MNKKSNLDPLLVVALIASVLCMACFYLLIALVVSAGNAIASAIASLA